MKIKNLKRVNAKGDYILLLIAFILFVIGIISLLSASAPQGLSMKGESYSYFKDQLMYAFIGAVLAIVIYMIDYRVYKNKILIIVGSIIMLALSFSVMFIGKSKYGAERWIALGGVTFQPSEVVKLGILFVIAFYIDFINKKRMIKHPFYSVLIPFVIIGLFAGITFVTQNHMSAAILMVGATLAQLFVAGVNFKVFWSLIAVGTSIIGIRNI